MANLPFKNSREMARTVNEIIHTDLNGPHHIVGYKGEKYFLTFIDDYSKCVRIYCIKNKSDTTNCFKHHVNFVENQFNKPVKRLQCNKGTEYINSELFNFASDKGIEILPCPTDVHELNGVVERYNRSAMDIARGLIKEARIDKKYWPEVIQTVAHLKNRTIANTRELKTPYEIYFGVKPKVDNLKIYGSKVFVRISEIHRKKWDDKARVRVLVGYTHFGYRVLINGKVIEARHVKVVEEDTKLICLENQDVVNQSSESCVSVENDDDSEDEVHENDRSENENSED